MFEFSTQAQDGAARVGRLVLPHGVVETPVFMPVGTHGAVKSASPSELDAVGSQIVLSNTYHMYLRPGDGLVADLGGLHGFMQWRKPMLTDSGGFQVFSLGERGMAGNAKKALRTVEEDGIRFRSHLDGSSHFFTPEKSIEIQQNLGADIMMAFDQPVYGLSSEEAAAVAMRRTKRWLERSIEQWKRGDTGKQAMFGIVQGGIHTDLHRESAEFTASLGLPGNAIGGLSVGEGKEEMWAATASIASLLPQEKPRYFMGLGEPTDLIEATMRGVDMYDCVSPSRLARHGAVWLPAGEQAAVDAFWQRDTDGLLRLGKPLRFERANLNNKRFAADPRPLAHPDSRMPADLKGFSLAILNHYLREHEMLGYRILTLHNVEVLHAVTEHMRAAIRSGTLAQLSGLLLPA